MAWRLKNPSGLNTECENIRGRAQPRGGETTPLVRALHSSGEASSYLVLRYRCSGQFAVSLSHKVACISIHIPFFVPSLPNTREKDRLSIVMAPLQCPGSCKGDSIYREPLSDVWHLQSGEERSAVWAAGAGVFCVWVTYLLIVVQKETMYILCICVYCNHSNYSPI